MLSVSARHHVVTWPRLRGPGQTRTVSAVSRPTIAASQFICFWHRLLFTCCSVFDTRLISPEEESCSSVPTGKHSKLTCCYSPALWKGTSLDCRQRRSCLNSPDQRCSSSSETALKTLLQRETERERVLETNLLCTITDWGRVTTDMVQDVWTEDID